MANNQGNTVNDGIMLAVIAITGWISRITMSDIAAVVTILGGTVYALNQVLVFMGKANTMYKNFKANRK